MVGIDVSTKAVALGVVPIVGEIDDIASVCFSIDSRKDTERCSEAATKTLIILSTIQESVDVTSVAIEMPRGFGGKIIPIVGAITGMLGDGNTEWYAPATWQSLIRKEFGVTKEDVEEMGAKKAIHSRVADGLGSDKFKPEFNEDMRDAVCIAIAHRLETLSSDELSDYDKKWLQGA